MGREAIAVCRWRGEMAEVKVLLEAREIILRGAMRLKVERTKIEAQTVEGEALIVSVAGEPLVLELGEKEALKWQAQLLKPLPTLAEKLGISESAKVLLLGTADDAELAGALVGAITDDPGEAALLLAVLSNEADLTQAIATARRTPDRHIWCVYGKGKQATLPDSEIRNAMREAGFADSKSCGISDKLTATRYRMKAAA